MSQRCSQEKETHQAAQIFAPSTFLMVQIKVSKQKDGYDDQCCQHTSAYKPPCPPERFSSFEKTDWLPSKFLDA